LKEYAQKDPRIKIITNEFNLGLTKNLNKAIRESKGRYIARFDCDDVSLPERLATQVAFMDTHPACGVVGLWAEIIDDQGAYLRTIKYPTEDKELKRVLISYNPFFHPGVLFRKEVFETIGFYDESWRFAQDYELYFRIAKQYELANVPQVLLRYRETFGSITGSKNRKQVGFVLKAKLKALREGQYSKFYYFGLFRSYISWLLPVRVKRLLKKIF
jgi:glycosyltransferase involved in cell wall biosynthesis